MGQARGYSVNYCLPQAAARLFSRNRLCPRGEVPLNLQDLGRRTGKSEAVVFLYTLHTDDVRREVLDALGEVFVLDWGEEEDGKTTFLDTFDWRLFNSGLTLEASRTKGGPSLLLGKPGSEAWEIRVRKFPAFPRDLPPGPAADLIQQAGGIRRILPRARVRRLCRTAAVLNEDTKTVARIRTTCGEVTWPEGGETRPLPATLEVQPLKGYGREAKELRSFLWRIFGLRSSRKSQLTLAMEALGETPGRDPSSPDFLLKPEMKASHAARIIHQGLLSVMEVNERGLMGDLDPEFLHDFRVAIRRARTALGQIKEVLPGTTVDHFRRELKWLGNRTGPTRDMDVYLLKIPAYQNALPDGVRDELEPLVHFLGEKKRSAHRSLVRTLRSRRYQAFKEEWAEFLETGETKEAEEEEAPRNAEKPILEVASARIWKLYRRVLKGGEGSDQHTPPEVLHNLRILCKRLRYLLTFFQSLYPQDELKPLIQKLKKLQDNLGDFNDLHVQQLALWRFADEMLERGVGPPETLMAMGRLMGQLETRQETERQAFALEFRKFAKPGNVKRFSKLFGPG